jgi:hypothetical protein
MTRHRIASALLATFAAEAALLWLGRTYGSTSAERRRALPGDELVADPHVITDHATTIGAPPDYVWPWLVQMGWGRAGWYTARWVDRLLFPRNGPSADVIVPELQDLRLGDRVLDGPPEANCSFVVERLEPDRHLVLHSLEHLPPGWAERGAGIDFTWSFVLDDLGNCRTRLHFRCRARLWPLWTRVVYVLAMVPADLVMSRQMMRGITARVERADPKPPVPATGAGSS